MKARRAGHLRLNDLIFSFSALVAVRPLCIVRGKAVLKGADQCMTESDVFDLDRFVKAQDPVIATVLQELRAGRKQTHWMWFIFPQLRGLGRSPIAQHYGIDSLAEARAYLGHAILRSRLEECVETVLEVSGKTLHEIFGSPDDTKFRSSMTLFAMANGNGSLFKQALDKYCDGQMDPETLKLLGVAGIGK